MNPFLPASALKSVSRRDLIRTLGATAAFALLPKFRAAAATDARDSLPMQFYKSLTEEQHAKICLPLDHVKHWYTRVRVDFWLFRFGRRAMPVAVGFIVVASAMMLGGATLIRRSWRKT